MSPIKFYSTADAYGEFSNFAEFPIRLDGEVWPTSEHYFQAQKFDDKAYQKKVRNASSPDRAAALGRDRSMKPRPDWQRYRLGTMRKAVLAKFTQHPELKALLLSTGAAKLIEHTPNDDYWGDGGDGTGQNMLGRILMEIRAQFAEEAQKSAAQ